MLARAEEVASPSSVLETRPLSALLLNYALVNQWSGPRESNSRDRFGRPQPRHSARPASIGQRSWTRTKEVPRDNGFTDRRNCCSAKRRIVGTSLTNRTPFIAVRSRNAGSTGRGVVLWRPSHGIQPGLLSLTRRAPSHLARRAHSSHACAIPQAIDECQPRHRRPACAYAYLPPVASCCCYPVVKELRTRRRCAGRKNKKARMLARSGPWAV
jgi:hypothetical protein